MLSRPARGRRRSSCPWPGGPGRCGRGRGPTNVGEVPHRSGQARQAVASRRPTPRRPRSSGASRGTAGRRGRARGRSGPVGQDQRLRVAVLRGEFADGRQLRFVGHLAGGGEGDAGLPKVGDGGAHDRQYRSLVRNLSMNVVTFFPLARLRISGSRVRRPVRRTLFTVRISFPVGRWHRSRPCVFRRERGGLPAGGRPDGAHPERVGGSAGPADCRRATRT